MFRSGPAGSISNVPPVTDDMTPLRTALAMAHVRWYHSTKAPVTSMCILIVRVAVGDHANVVALLLFLLDIVDPSFAFASVWAVA